MKWLTLLVGLIAAPALAVTPSVSPEAAAIALAAGKDKDKEGEDEGGGEPPELSPEELRAQANADAAAAKRAEAPSRVIVLQYSDTDVGYTHPTVQVNVRSRIARADAKFYPEIDLYQFGRAERDKTLHHGDQRAQVPDRMIDEMQVWAEEVGSLPWNALDTNQWAQKADEGREILDRDVWFVDREELREPLFLMYVAIGYAADNLGNNSPLYFVPINGTPYNKYYYLAGTLAHQTPDLLSKVSDLSRRSSVEYMKDMIDDPDVRPLTLSMDRAGEFDFEGFNNDFVVRVNGHVVDPSAFDLSGKIEVPPGIAHVYLERPGDGHSLSFQVEQFTPEEEIMRVVDDARERMGDEFQDQLMKDPYRCIPDLEGEILDYLSIYAKLHPDSDVYVVVPAGGNPNKVFIWMWDHAQELLIRILPTVNYPVRFATLFNVGMAFNGANLEFQEPTEEDVTASATGQAGGLDPLAPTDGLTPTVAVAGMPIDGQLRIHYGRFMVLGGAQWVYSLDGQWSDFYRTRYPKSGDYAIASNPTVASKGTTPSTDPGDGGSEDTTTTDSTQPITYKERAFSPLYYGGVGIVFMRNAVVGIGPRIYARVGYYQIPNAADLTLHAGITSKAPFSQASQRVRPLVDLDFFGGGMLPAKFSALNKNGEFADIGGPAAGEFSNFYLNFGLTVGFGLTF